MAAKTYKGTNAYSGKWAEAHKKIHEAIEQDKKPIPFFLEALGGTLEAEVKLVDPDDIYGSTISKWNNDESKIQIKEWSPDKHQGFHALCLEKALLCRYSPEQYKDIKELYTGAQKEIQQIESMAKKYKESISFD